MSLSVITLGTASAIPSPSRYSTAHLLNADEHFYLIDCGEGTQMQLKRFKTKFQRINHIFISHLHGDHVFGLAPFLSTLSMMGRKNDMHIYAHKDLKKILMQILYQFSHNMTYRIEFHPLNTEEKTLILDDDKLRIWSFPLRHRTPSCGFIFEQAPRKLNIKKEMIELYDIPLRAIPAIKDGADFVMEDGTIIPNSRLTIDRQKSYSYAYCSDTMPFDEEVDYIKNVDLLYHEATFLSTDKHLAEITFHSTAAEAAQIAQRAGAKQLIIGHFSSRYKDVSVLEKEARAIFPNTDAAFDGYTYTMS